MTKNARAIHTRQTSHQHFGYLKNQQFNQQVKGPILHQHQKGHAKENLVSLHKDPAANSKLYQAISASGYIPKPYLLPRTLEQVAGKAKNLMTQMKRKFHMKS